MNWSLQTLQIHHADETTSWVPAPRKARCDSKPTWERIETPQAGSGKLYGHLDNHGERPNGAVFGVTVEAMDRMGSW